MQKTTEMNATTKKEIYEIIGQAKGHRHIDGYVYDEDNPWWYCYKLIRTDDADILIDELSKLV